MAALSVQVPYPVFYDRDGQPIDNGNIYIGVANLDPVTNPLQVYYDEALTITASQPLKTSSGYVYRNGTPTQLYVNAVNFSILVNDSSNLLVYSFTEATGISPNASGITYDPPFTGGVATTVEEKLSQTVSPIDFGAVGDGVTDDRAALKAALESGFPVDGCGYAYAINGNCSPTSIAGFQNATLLQIGNKTSTNYRTLNIVGSSDFFIDNITIDTGSGITSIFSDDGASALYIGGTNESTSSLNFNVTRVTVTGNGCGAGIHIRHAERFNISDCLVHDRVSGSSPDPTNDSQNGIEIVNAANFTMVNCQVYNLQTRLGGVATIKWTRGFLFAEIRDCAITGCNSTRVDQGYDFSGAYENAPSFTFIGNRRWTIAGCTANSCDTVGFKFANVARDGLVTGCIANTIGGIGFLFSPSSVALPVGLEEYNTQNIDVVGCKAVNMLGNSWAYGTDAIGFLVDRQPTYPTYPRAIRIKDSAVVDNQTVPTTQFGFVDDVNDVSYPATGYNSNIANTISGCTVTGANVVLASNIGPVICQVTNATVPTQSIPNSTWTNLQWDDKTYDPSALLNVASNNTNIYIKSPGWYRLLTLVNFTSNATGVRQVRFKINNVTIDRCTAIGVGTSTTDTVLVTSTMRYANPGDYFSVEAFQSSGGALDFKGNESSFSVELIGG